MWYHNQHSRETQIVVYRTGAGAPKPPLCKGRCPVGAEGLRSISVVKPPEFRRIRNPAKQSPSQKSEIFDSPLYTRGPLGAAVIGAINYNLEFINKLQRPFPVETDVSFSTFSIILKSFYCRNIQNRQDFTQILHNSDIRFDFCRILCYYFKCKLYMKGL